MIERIDFREAHIPEPIEITGKNEWISWGSDNLYPQFLIGLYYNSSIHGGIINSKTKYIFSDGIDYKGTDLSKWELIKKNGNAPYSFNEIAAFCVKDFELLDTFCVLFRLNPISKFYDMHHVSAELVRIGEDQEYFFYSENWKDRTQTFEKTGFKKIKNINDFQRGDKEVMLYVSSKAKQFQMASGKLTKNTYPIVSYSGAISSIMASIEMNQFSYFEAVNSFKSGTLISVNNGVPNSEDERKHILKELKEGATAKNNQGGITVMFSDGKEREPTISQINSNDMPQRYLLAKESIVDDIMVGHSVISPSLFGIKTPGQLGGGAELETAYSLFITNYAGERQKTIIDAFMYAEYLLNDFSGELFFIDKPLQLEGKSVNSPIAKRLNAMSPLLANKVLSSLTTNEIRSMAGLMDIAGGDVIETAIPQTFSSVFNLFEAYGRDASDYEVVKERVQDEYDEQSEIEFKDFFASDLSLDQQKIITMVSNGESYQAIVTAIDKGASFVTKQLIDLEAKGMIKGWEVTSKGNENKASKFEVVYKYALRDELSGPVLIPTSRDFCVQMIEANKIFSREEINKVGEQAKNKGLVEDSNIWRYRGGAWQNKGVTLPACRHVWKQQLIKKK